MKQNNYLKKLVLQRINAASKSLQSIAYTIFKDVSLLQALETLTGETIRHSFTKVALEVENLTDKTLTMIASKSHPQKIQERILYVGNVSHFIYREQIT